MARRKAAAERYGFTYEGLFRQAMVYKGRNRDTAWFSITDKEWPAIKRGFSSGSSRPISTPHGSQKAKLAELIVIAQARLR